MPTATTTVRPIDVSDADRLARMFERLSRESIYYRFFSPVSRLSSSVLLRLADVDHCHRDALVALEGDEIVAVARYDGLAAVSGPDGSTLCEAEIAVTVEDARQRTGMGYELTRQLSELARAWGCDTFVARILPGNRAALALVRKLAPDVSVRFNGGDYEARLPLT